MATKEFNRNKTALKNAVKQTKAQLKGVAKEVTVTTYPKGVWKKTLKKNFEKNVTLLGGKPAKEAPAKKVTTETITPKKRIEWTPMLKKKAAAELLVVVNRQETAKVDHLAGLTNDRFGNMVYKGKKYTYSAKPYRYQGKGPVLFNVRVD
ncbi:hypothetical protein [Emticicia sp. BO119]|uniref:hypothetical protein n=1 Tax=Emticicia sp. BO119 TaxID=2757768 RepID=UPI0015F0C606|nr:hypothetical protein [Emticicia sp. BO119]MBA4849487.1 hypothetical protein [Emticicia sp. BO119]